MGVVYAKIAGAHMAEILSKSILYHQMLLEGLLLSSSFNKGKTLRQMKSCHSPRLLIDSLANF